MRGSRCWYKLKDSSIFVIYKGQGLVESLYLKNMYLKKNKWNNSYIFLHGHTQPLKKKRLLMVLYNETLIYLKHSLNFPHKCIYRTRQQLKELGQCWDKSIFNLFSTHKYNPFKLWKYKIINCLMKILIVKFLYIN